MELDRKQDGRQWYREAEGGHSWSNERVARCMYALGFLPGPTSLRQTNNKKLLTMACRLHAG